VDRLRRLASGPVRRVRRARPRHLVAAAIAAWGLAVLLPLASSLPPALATGAVIRKMHGELSPLRSGWYYVESTGSGASTFTWEWSDGPVSTIAVQPGWHEVSLLLQAVTCPGNQLQHVVFHAPGTAMTHLLRVGTTWKWYRVPLGWAHGAEVVSLHYRCVVVPARLHDGDPDQRALAIDIAGLEPNAP
jgi:hypothetical protein